MKNIYEVAAANKRKSFLIMVLFVLFITFSVYFISQAFSIYMGYEAGGLGVVGIALIVSGLMSIGSYYYSDRIVLAITKARPASRETEFDLYTVTENLSMAAGLPTPRVYVIEDEAMNAFATGRNPEHAVVAATTGLLKKLNRSELEGVIAHELTHIKNYDILVMSTVAVLVGTVALLADFFLRMSFTGSGNRENNKGSTGAIIVVVGLIFAILAPIAGQLIKLAISRRREFMADAGAVVITRQPNGLMSALEKISSDHTPFKTANKATAHMFIANPFKDKGHGAADWFSSLFNTHPPVSKRLEALSQMV